MALYLVAVPIGDPKDLTLRGLECLTQCPIIILEERKEGSRILREQGLTGKQYFELNEHSSKEDLQELVQLCAKNEVALITDAGTPGFCDPGADLVNLCRKQNIRIQSLPGASSLMLLLSLSSCRIDQFIFRGFLPAENETREKAWLEIRREPRAIVLMDTPYRLQKMVLEISLHFPERKILLGTDFTQPGEVVWEGLGKDLVKVVLPKKAEFMILVYAK